uniref:Putative vesicle transport through interaction with t-snares protein 1b n=1 Tax=Anopheles marajoara TaxID=58244 RepID=A0A2M4C4Z9_9DIPT
MGDYDWTEHHRQQVLQGRQILERTSASLARSNQIAIETEHTGHEVISELEVQRESLLRSQRRLENANEHLSKSGAILRAMKRNVLYNKLILILIIVMEVVILAGMIYLKFIN